MMPRTDNADQPTTLHGAQVPVLGSEGQERLRAARVHVSGAGRIGSSIVLHCASAGVGSISANDAQAIEPEDLGSFAFARPSDIGQKKVYILERLLHGRPHFVFTPVVALTESESVDPYLRDADLVISCANT